MPELRFDVLSNNWVILAPEREKRPFDFHKTPIATKNNINNPKKHNCPFCPGNEEETPPAVLTIPKEPSNSQWRIRVVPNKYAALSEKEKPPKFPFIPSTLNYKTTAFGYHEVIIIHPDHNISLADLNSKEWLNIFEAINIRKQLIYEDKTIKYLQIICNNGPKAGASLSHPHFQLFGLPFIPPIVQKKNDQFLNYFSRQKKCLLCSLLKKEKKSGKRILKENKYFLAWLPFASLTPFQINIAPLKHEKTLPQKGKKLTALADILNFVFTSLQKKLEQPNFSFYFYINPNNHKDNFHFHIVIRPILAHMGGFEYATGTFINSINPNKATKYLLNNTG